MAEPPAPAPIPITFEEALDLYIATSECVRYFVANMSNHPLALCLINAQLVALRMIQQSRPPS